MAFIHSTPWALYNEIDEFAAAWLEQLIAAGLIARGVVDRRSIADIRPYDLRGFRQVHLFAGIGVWSYSFRCAGITDDTEAWSASCPCQPFSDAGEGGGMDDERHLWPHAHHLIRERRPRLIFGEQVASKDGLAWLDLVQADMEGTSYAFGAVDTCAAGFGAPHIRQRQYWFAERLADAESLDSRSGLRDCGPTGLGWDQLIDGRSIDGLDNHDHPGLEGFGSGHRAEAGQREGSLRPTSTAGELGWLADGDQHEQRQGGSTGSTICEGLRFEPSRCGDTIGMGNSNSNGTGRDGGSLCGPFNGEDGELISDDVVTPSSIDRVANDKGSGWGEQRSDASGSRERSGTEELEQRPWRRSLFGHNRPTGPTNGFWEDVDWLHCRDERWRPVEPGTFPLAHGAAARVGRLRGYGNAINAEQAIGFIEAYLETKAIEVNLESAHLADEPAFEDLI